MYVNDCGPLCSGYPWGQGCLVSHPDNCLAALPSAEVLWDITDPDTTQ